jgi:hypothetical protein
VRVGLIQNSISLPTTAPYSEQKKAIMEKIKNMIDAAGTSGVNILCLQVHQILCHFFSHKNQTVISVLYRPCCDHCIQVVIHLLIVLVGVYQCWDVNYSCKAP